MKFGYTILYVKNVKKTVEFYTKVFQMNLKFLHDSEQYAEMDTGATTLALASEELAKSNKLNFRVNATDSEPAGFEVGLVVDDVEAAFKFAVENGAEQVVEPHTKPWGQSVSYVKDNNGILFELCSQVEPMGEVKAEEH